MELFNRLNTKMILYNQCLYRSTIYSYFGTETLIAVKTCNFFNYITY